MLLKTVLFMFLATAARAGPMHIETEAVVQMCNANNATDKVDQVKILMDEFNECEPKMIDYTQVPTDFEEARIGTVDEVAKKTCAKATQTKICMEKMNTAVALCSEGEQKNIRFRLVIWDRIIDYMCYKEDGRTRLAKFVNDGGIRCFTSSVDLVQCGPTASTDMMSAFADMTKCMIDQLKPCSNAAAIRAQGMFDYVRNGPPSSTNNQL